VAVVMAQAVARPRAEAALAAPNPTAASENEPLVLIVEDNPDMLTYIGSHLQGQFSVVEAVNGAEGLRLARELVPDVVISDVMMPEMDGYDLCRTLKADEATSHIPVILLTAKAGEDSLLEGLDRGADAYLVKPFSAVELRLRTRKLIELRRTLQKRYCDRVIVLGNEETDLPAREAVFLDKIRKVIQENMAHIDFGVDALADGGSMSRRQLLRKLRALVDEAPGDVIRRVRLEHAAQLLRSQQLSFKEAAPRTGFSSAPYFSRAFRQHFRVPPGEYARLSPGEVS
jgi:DNA-binding response OmpR family regulator